jgi:uncharacterized protein YjiS (DUF1127 family)
MMTMQQLNATRRPLLASRTTTPGIPWFDARAALAWACAAHAWARACLARVRQRRALAQLDARLLRDIGRDRVAVAREIEKPFWRR